MRQNPKDTRDAADRTVRDIRRKTRKRYSAEEKIRIVLAGLRGDGPVFTHSLSVCAVQPILVAIEETAVHLYGCSPS